MHYMHPFGHKSRFGSVYKSKHFLRYSSRSWGDFLRLLPGTLSNDQVLYKFASSNAFSWFQFDHSIAGYFGDDSTCVFASATRYVRKNWIPWVFFSHLKLQYLIFWNSYQVSSETHLERENLDDLCNFLVFFQLTSYYAWTYVIGCCRNQTTWVDEFSATVPDRMWKDFFTHLLLPTVISLW